jgi:hypothetical protein
MRVSNESDSGSELDEEERRNGLEGMGIITWFRLHKQGGFPQAG